VLTDSDLMGESGPTVTRALSGSGWLQKLYSLLGRGKREEASAIVAVVNATKPVGLRNTKRASSIRRQQTAFIVHEEPAL
jgi:hypothetical protein